MKLAINGSKPVRTSPFPHWPSWDETERENLISVLESGKWGSIHGKQVRAFEDDFAAFQGAKFGIATTNGTSALEIALRSIGLEVGDEVILPAYTFIASAVAILNNGAVPVFVDIDPETYNIDPGQIEASITERTKAIMPVHFAGRPADMDSIQAIAERHKLYVVEDAAQAWGAKWRDQGVGRIGQLGCFSFQSSKNLTAGEGGIVLTDSEEYAQLAGSYANCGRMADGLWYAHYWLAGNERMTEFQAAILRAQLARYPKELAIRQESMAYLDEHLTKVSGILALEHEARMTSHACHLYIFRYQPEQFNGLTKARFIEALRAEGIPCSPGYSIPLYEQPIFKKSEFGPFKTLLQNRFNYITIHLPNTERACKDEAIWLTQNTLLDGPAGMQSVVDAIEKIAENHKELL
ncbi:MAG: DegT/DnrJ/EryC1/StrS family aminotransferase [bacterium]